ncbi:MAG: adenosylcobinamide-GDP ribazoletransferase [Rhodobacterales bacterium]|nr:MAG: adenosylcobinamide-GDP ribazoletransferase [Rhodobacterales bacterium]
MHENDALMDRQDLPVALSLLTRLPLHLPETAYARGARTAWAWGVVGAMLGALGGAVWLLASALGFSAFVSAALALSTLTVLTGAMHEDGLADCADGFWGGYDRARRLAIMKDSQIGTYGVLALVGLFILRLGAVTGLDAAHDVMIALISAGAGSRAVMAGIMQALPNARGTGLSSRTGQPGWAAVGAGGVLAGGLSLCLLGLFATLICIAVGLGTALLWARIARVKIGGQTGDVLGATQQLVETALLLTLTTLL